MKKDLLKGLTEEQIAKLHACKNQEEILAIAKEEGVELTPEQLEAVSGGCLAKEASMPCPKCRSTDTQYFAGMYQCKKCGHVWQTNFQEGQIAAIGSIID